MNPNQNNQFNSSSLGQNVITYQGYGPQSTTHGGNIQHMLRTANMTREDFNIEDLHYQVVVKLQRQRRVLREIEQNPAEREQEEYFFMDESTEMYPIGKKSSNNARTSSKKPQGNYPQRVVRCSDESVLATDGCSKPAITFGIKG